MATFAAISANIFDASKQIEHMLLIRFWNFIKKSPFLCIRFLNNLLEEQFSFTLLCALTERLLIEKTPDNYSQKSTEEFDLLDVVCYGQIKHSLIIDRNSLIFVLL